MPKKPAKKKLVSKAAKEAFAKKKAYTQRHKDGSIWAKGFVENGKMVGVWKWFRKEGGIMRSGRFENGKQVGEWITYDRKGKVVKVTKMK